MALRVLQQPERARLCSFKEENDTIDRRPVDPPPVVQLLKGANDSYDLFEFTAYFIRASIVHPHPSHASDDVTADDYLPVKTPTGADSTAGEVIQTPELLKGLDGQYASMVIFAKLSVRVPGVFRLKFTLYQNTSHGVEEITSVVSDPFEVFSPKLFKGMRESTPLTRHLASQGLKVKLRTDTTVGRHDARKKTARTNRAASATAAEPPRTTSPMSRSSVESHVLPAPLPVAPIQIPGPSRSAPNYMAPPPYPPPHSGYNRSAPPHPPGPSRSLVWHPSLNHLYSEPTLRSPATPSNRYGDDGSIPSLRDISSRFDHTPDFPSADLSAFSLSADSKRSSDSNTSSARPYSTRASSSSSSVSRNFSPYSVPSSATSLSNSLPSRSSRSGSPGDDGMPVLPSFLLPGPSSSGPLLPPPHPSLASVLSQPAFSNHPGTPVPSSRGGPSAEGNLEKDPRR